MTSYDRKTLEELFEGRLPADQLNAMRSAHKDPARFEQMMEIHAARLRWPERLLLPLGESLYIVETTSGERVVYCECRHDFGDYRVNWKLSALIFVRDTDALMQEVYSASSSADPDWMELREFYCPGCLRQLEVEAVPPGYPVVFDFEPDLETFYDEWLGTPLADSG
ncbi:MAG: acetone carboxylase, gamma subunit [Chloroflexota bacterium]|jgi:acetone carboxylase gamma subunit|nr:acetone carboxylase, gamma subunit [Chloroflexota bacterium]